MKARALESGFALPSPPKRTPLAEEAAQRFTLTAAPDGPSGDADAPSRPRMKGPASSSRLRRAELGERVAVYLPPELAAELRIRCAKERRSLSDAVTVAVETWARRPEGT